MQSKNKGKKVYVGISGGVDSSVAAALLVRDGYDVTGVFINVWQPPFMECTSRDDRRDAMRVCAQLGIPFMDCDAVEAYKKQVVDYMIDEYRIGRIPNPDVMCNTHVKFGVFYNWAITNGADYVSTGHYAQVMDGKLYKSVDIAKEQSYFLYGIKKKDLENILFPIGALEKSEVRKLAEKFKLFTYEKKDSQGLCFLGKLDMKDFLKNFIEERKGYVLDQKGKIISCHEGAFFYSIGERHGFTITVKTDTDKPLYVLNKNIENNSITVGPKDSVNSSGKYILDLTNINILDHDKWENGENLTAQYRYHGELIKVDLKGRKVYAESGFPATIASGQSLVIYDGEECVGGGIIE